MWRKKGLLYKHHQDIFFSWFNNSEINHGAMDNHGEWSIYIENTRVVHRACLIWEGGKKSSCCDTVDHNNLPVCGKEIKRLKVKTEMKWLYLV